MSTEIVVTLTMVSEDAELMTKAIEKLHRVQLGLALDGINTTVSMTTVEYSEAEAEDPQ